MQDPQQVISLLGRSPMGETLSISSITSRSRFPIHRLVEYFGTVNYATNDRVLSNIKDHLAQTPSEELVMLVTSPGGPSGTAMSFYDTVRLILKPKLTTVGIGDVDSSGIIIFLSGSKRMVTPHTTLLFHKAGRSFGDGKRYTAAEMEAMCKEDKLKDHQYAEVVAKNSAGRLTPEQVLLMMECSTVLTGQELVRMGLAEGVLQ